MTTLIECAARSALLIGIVWALLKVLRIGNPRLERNVWIAVLAASLAMPWLIDLPAMFSPTAPQMRWLYQLQGVVVQPVMQAEVDWAGIIAYAVLAVSAVLFVRQSVGIVRLWRVRASAHKIEAALDGIDVRVSTQLRSPATVFSTVLVPEDFDTWTPQQQAAVLAHERAHVRNRDFHVQWLAQLHRCLFWFNPLAWWLTRRLALLGEHISDDAALDATAERTAYADLLLGFAQRAVRHEQAVAMIGRNAIAARIERILAGRRPAYVSRTKRWLLLAVLAPIVGIAASFNAVDARAVVTELALQTTNRAGSTDPQDFIALHPGSHVIAPRSNPLRPFSQPDYPSLSRQLGEQGTVTLRLLVLEDGSVADAVVHQSSGYPYLDYSAMYEAFRWQVDPGAVDGAPARMWAQFKVTFRLED